MEIYETLYTGFAYEAEQGDLISFTYRDEDDETYTETVMVTNVDGDGDQTFITGFSEVTNMTETFVLEDMTEISLLGG